MADAERQGELWGRAPAGWAQLQERMHTPLWTAMLDATSVTDGTRVLDAGCGSGGAAALAAERGAHVSGLDAAAGLIAFARRRVPAGDFRIGDLERLPFDDGEFHVVIAANSIQYAVDRVRALRELRRVCAADGRVAAGLFGPPEGVAFAAVLRALGEAMPGPPRGGGPFELSSPGTLESLVERAGLTVDETGEADCPFEYPDLETFWAAHVAAGPVQGMLEVVEEPVLRAAATGAVAPFVRSDGTILIAPNVFRYVVASA